MRSPRILVLYNEPVLPLTHPDAESEHEIIYTVDFVSKTLLQAGFDVTRLGVNDDPDVLLEGLRAQRPDGVFNLFEGTADHGHTEAFVVGLLEWLGVPFTGSPFQTLSLARSKPLTKHLLQGAGLPTPHFFVVENLPVPDCPLEWPVIVKPALEDASVGLDQGSVVTDQHALQERVRRLLAAYGPPVLVEQFIRGREFNVGIIETPELRVLPVSEVLFVDKDPGYWPIVTYDAKWKPGSHDYEATPPRYPAEIAPKLAERLGNLACQAFRLLGCRDYARVDFRVRPSGKPYILEVNPNPDFSPTAGLAGGLASAGLPHAQFTGDLVRAALARGKRSPAQRICPSPDPHVRPVRAEDRGPLRQVLQTCKGVRPEEAAATLERLEGALANHGASAYHGLVVELDHQAAGFACFGKAPSPEGAYQLYGIALAPPHRGRGLGRRLLQAVEAEVLAGGGKTLLVLSSSQPLSSRARKFYLRQGFRLVGNGPGGFPAGDGRLTFIKDLAGTCPAEAP
jgi:D-alanine-D-alanine ligase